MSLVKITVGAALRGRPPYNGGPPLQLLLLVVQIVAGIRVNGALV